LAGRQFIPLAQTNPATSFIASLIETYKLNAVDPHAWLDRTLTAIARGHLQSNITDLMPWNYAAKV
jgi:hypothetical protein